MPKCRHRLKVFDEPQQADEFLSSLQYDDALNDPVLAVEFVDDKIYVWYVEEVPPCKH